MVNSNATHVSLKGRFLSYELDGCEISHIWLAVPTEQYLIKLGHKMRKKLLEQALLGKIRINDWIEVSGIPRTGRWKRKNLRKPIKLKVKAIQRLSSPTQTESKGQVGVFNAKRSPLKVAVCQKSNCNKRGGKKVYKALSKEITKNQLNQRFQLVSAGCLGKCSKGPNVMVGQTRYHKVASTDAEKLFASHLP